MISQLDEDDALEVINLLVGLALSYPSLKDPVLRLLKEDVERVNATKGKKGSYKNAGKLSTLYVTIKLIEGDGKLTEHSNKELAQSQNISESTMTNYINSLCDKIAGIEGLVDEILKLTDLPFRIRIKR
jgi:DNA-binding NarL/FixJ family response regulator